MDRREFIQLGIGVAALPFIPQIEEKKPLYTPPKKVNYFLLSQPVGYSSNPEHNYSQGFFGVLNDFDIVRSDKGWWYIHLDVDEKTKDDLCKYVDEHLKTHGRTFALKVQTEKNCFTHDVCMLYGDRPWEKIGCSLLKSPLFEMAYLPTTSSFSIKYKARFNSYKQDGPGDVLLHQYGIEYFSASNLLHVILDKQHEQVIEMMKDDLFQIEIYKSIPGKENESWAKMFQPSPIGIFENLKMINNYSHTSTGHAKSAMQFCTLKG